MSSLDVWRHAVCNRANRVRDSDTWRASVLQPRPQTLTENADGALNGVVRPRGRTKDVADGVAGGTTAVVDEDCQGTLRTVDVTRRRYKFRDALARGRIRGDEAAGAGERASELVVERGGDSAHVMNLIAPRALSAAVHARDAGRLVSRNVGICAHEALLAACVCDHVEARSQEFLGDGEADACAR